jgi:DNA polymerase III subunit delta
MIIKSYEIKNKIIFSKHKSFLLYGENVGLKKDIKKFISSNLKLKDNNIENVSIEESEIINNEEVFYNHIYSGSLFSSKKIVIIYGGSDKIIKKIEDIFEKFPDNIFLIIFSEILEKKSKLRKFYEGSESCICIPCYLDNEKDLYTIAQSELKKNNISLSKESMNLLIDKSNSDRNNLRNEIEKIKSYSLNKKNIDLNQLRSLINFSGEYKSDVLINECLSGNVSQYKKVLSELYSSTINQVLLFRIFNNKIHRLLKFKEEEDKSKSIDILINSSKPPIFWKDKPILKKQLSLWNLIDLKIIVEEANNTELLCKKNPHIANSIFFNFFSEVCEKANSFS